MLIPAHQRLYAIILKRNGLNNGHLEVLKNILFSLGVAREEVVEYSDGKCHSLSIYFRSLTKARILGQKIIQLSLKNIQIFLRGLGPSDWQNRWKKDIKPFTLTSRIMVVPSWLKSRYPQDKFELIYLDPALAFGSGLHETTRFVAGFIEQYQGRFETFADLGTGTGILTITALKCGAAVTRAVDISPEAVKAAKQNLRYNGYFPRGIMVKDVRNLKIFRRYDFVAANLITNDLINLKNKILGCVKPKGYLAVSGISLENLPEFRRVYQRLPLRCLKIEKGEKWAALLYQRR